MEPADQRAPAGRLGLSDHDLTVDVLVHELKQPLTSILLTAQAGVGALNAMPDSTSTREIRDMLAEIIDIDLRAAAVMDRVRSLMSNAPLNIESLRPRDLIAHALACTEQRTAATDLIVQNDVDGDISIRGDASQLQQVLINLIINACDAVASKPLDERLLRFAVDSRADGSTVFTISDSGSGIDVHPIEQIFEPFVTSKRGGSGLGLAISHMVVARHGGRMWARNKPDGGARFFVLLPSLVNDEPMRRISEGDSNRPSRRPAVERRRAAESRAARARLLETLRATCDALRTTWPRLNPARRVSETR